MTRLQNATRIVQLVCVELSALQGPFCLAELREWAAAGDLPADMSVWHQARPAAGSALSIPRAAEVAAAAAAERSVRTRPHVGRIGASRLSVPLCVSVKGGKSVHLGATAAGRAPASTGLCQVPHVGLHAGSLSLHRTVCSTSLSSGLRACP